MSVAEVEEVRVRIAPTTVPLDEMRDSQPEESASPAELAELKEGVQMLRAALAELPRRDLEILSMYYQDALTLKEIGSILEVSESRVCQLRTRALSRLRELMR
jgi:RNA polymerase sigma factor for flagellar operon FliA